MFSYVIARRGVSVGKMYLAVSLLLLAINIVISLQSGGKSAVMSLSLAMLGFIGLTGAAPVMLLYVYDRNNGTLEYLLSLGMNQLDIFRGYLAASLVIGCVLQVIGSIVILGVGVSLGALSISTLVSLVLSTVMALSAICLAAIFMMSYDALQKQPFGGNQPLGLGVGGLLLVVFMFIPLIFPEFVVMTQLAVAVFVFAISMLFVYLSPRFIRREKMLP
jgi:hypothetical protein